MKNLIEKFIDKINLRIDPRKTNVIGNDNNVKISDRDIIETNIDNSRKTNK